MIAAVTGATGYVGQFVTARLLAEGVHVRAWHRGDAPPDLFPEAEWLRGDLRDEPAMRRLVAGCDLLVHCALEHVPSRYRGGEGDDLAAFQEANLVGSIRLLGAARASGVGRAVVLSSRAALGDRRPPGQLGDEAVLMPDTHYGAVKAGLEAVVSAYGRGEGWPVAAIRPTGVYGLIAPVERSKWFALVAAALAGGAMLPPRSATEVHGSDVADAVWRIATAAPERIAGRAFNCSDMVVDHADLVEMLAARLGRELAVPPRSAPPAVTMACPGLEALGVRFGGPPRLAETLDGLVEAAAACAAAG
ncbi:NAD-dependent epimerase/dehydratase family protein [Faunimonas sp. B44]|uniref:NAD-dependent epimerase/dehydratase family protein n=1 Tax=Faunimonas sp. B44 TaxID=3461493 RepID=UPI004044E86E